MNKDVLKNSLYYLKNQDKIKKRTSLYYKQNKEYYQQYNLFYRQKNKLKIKKQQESNKEHYKKLRKNRNLEKLKNNPNMYHEQYLLRKQYYKEYSKKYRESHKEEVNKQQHEYRKNKRKKNLSFKILCNLRIRIYDALHGKNKSEKTMKLLGCTIDELKKHLESKFKNGMSWKNYCRIGWHIDHIKPCSSFDLSKTSEQKKCFHYTNLQPLWAEDNLKKSNKY